MGGILMKIREDEKAQTSAEMILLFGGIIVIAIVALIVYKNYTNGLGSNMNGAVDTLNGKIKALPA
jgi:uncharacterized protein (UPF0333 family)